jgi:hypothetical protein
MTNDKPDAGRARLRLVSDDDGHEFVIPADKREEFRRWEESDAAMDGEPPPAWAKPINMHHSNYTFTDWEEDR